jgi:alanine dehydrogenase
MRVGVPTEIREDEYRVALTPAGTKELSSKGHEVLVQHGAGAGSFITDEEYVAAGGRIVPDADAVFDQCELIVKVKEPLESEYRRLQPHHILFTYLHLAPDPELTAALIASRATCIAYETVETVDGRKPLLRPMSEIAGRLAPQVGAYLLSRMSGGKGKLLSGATGVKKANVVILGAGTAGLNAASIALGMGARTVLLDINNESLLTAQRQLPGVQTLQSDQLTIETEVVNADVLIGAILVSGAKTPVVVREDTVRGMQPGSVIVDLSVDQGGCIETSRVTTHREPTFVKHGVIHYCVDNMAGVVPITSTVALTNVTLPYILALADKGVVSAARSDPLLARGVNVMEGKVTRQEIAAATGNQYFPLEYVLPIEYT